MKDLAAALMFLACLGWIAASLVLTGHAAHNMGSWDWLAVIGAMFAFFKVIG
jgi:hypothetical protein